GIVVLIESLLIGMKALTYSAQEAIEEDERKGEKGLSNFAMTLTLLISFVLGLGLFVILPAFLAGEVTDKGWAFNLIDGFIRLVMFFGYILAISLMPDIRRVFEYHGAEHKSIYAYESGEELSVENASKYSTLHPRCGTAFLLTVMVVSILVFSILGKPSSYFIRFGSRVVLIPLIAGISYEVIRLASKRSQSGIMRIVIAPGLLLQRLTTREPSSDQLQVAISALKELVRSEERCDIS
ncbi:TPA: DUF1385 domain-containing protein, partial [Candidatus Poribacteria bacterium]|nr:DUF1385 domain-containing protein [Candidatus Poribacteria bacterium]HEX29097.1 DUF1385 domain-containing protein [Candidatus Poribacteria bacterium]